MHQPTDYYTALQVNPAAHQVVIAAAYQALTSHLFLDPRTAAPFHEAYNVLSDPATRAIYDQKRAKDLQLNGYEVVEKIGAGAFGPTYKIKHQLTGELSCLKHCSKLSAEGNDILRQETIAMWNLRHFGIPAVRDLIQLNNGNLALIMSYVEGPTLHQTLHHNGALEAEHVAWIAQRILNILLYLHERNVYHGDLSPKNIIIQPEHHTVVLIDYGLAMVKPAADTENKGYRMYYSAPEQENKAPLTPQCDLYSLGMTMIAALTGGDESALKTRRIPSTVPRAMQQFIQRLIATDPDDRPAVWAKENLFATVQEMRRQAFGRTHTHT